MRWKGVGSGGCLFCLLPTDWYFPRRIELGVGNNCVRLSVPTVSVRLYEECIHAQ